MKVQARFRLITSIAFSLLLFLAVGCGGHSSTPVDCSTAVAIGVSPNPASADHLAAPPGNKVSFVGGDVLPASCTPRPDIRLDLKWSVSDATDVTIGNTPNVDYGIATCNNATPAPATVTASGPNERGQTITGTATLTCK